MLVAEKANREVWIEHNRTKRYEYNYGNFDEEIAEYSNQVETISEYDQQAMDYMNSFISEIEDTARLYMDVTWNTENMIPEEIELE